MILGVFERLILLNILPKEGDFLTLKILMKLKEQLSFSEEEYKQLQFRRQGEKFEDIDGSIKEVPEGKVLWRQDKDIPKDIPIGEKAEDIIVGALKTLDKKKMLQVEHLSIYEKFIKE
jgi:hypothetical protein